MKKVLLMAAVLLGSTAAVFAQDAKALNDEVQALKAQVDKGQQALILGQGDANQFYGLVDQLFDKVYECDKVAEQPDAKGKVKNKFRKANAELLNQNRPQLINGGVEAFNNNENAKALKYFGKYIDAAKHPMMEKFNYAATDTMIPLISYYACIAAAREENHDAVPKYADEAVKDKENGASALELKCASLKATNKNDEFLAALKEGLEKFPNDNYFVGNMIDYYTNNNQYAEALTYIDSQITKNPNNDYFYFVKGYLYQTQKNYEEADKAYAKSVSMNPNSAQAQSYAGLNLCQQAIALGEDPNVSEATLEDLYRRALPYYEKARELAPDDKTLWLNGLYTCYYRLKMTEKAAEIEKLM
jgi:tetratricopeptide (TPR) repeat protein